MHNSIIWHRPGGLPSVFHTNFRKCLTALLYTALIEGGRDNCTTQSNSSHQTPTDPMVPGPATLLPLVPELETSKWDKASATLLGKLGKKNQRNPSHDNADELGWGGVGVIDKPRICFGFPHLLRGDDVNLSPEGCYIYLDNMARRMSAVLLELDEGKGDSN